MKKKMTLAILIMGVCFINFREVLAVENSYTDVNIVTTIGKPVEFPELVTGLDQKGKIIKEKVIWDGVDKAIFESVGRYVINGRSADDEKIKGIITVFSNQRAVKVAAIGDSITYGMNVENVINNAYPKQLEKRLGTEYHVMNYGNIAKTLMETGEDPYIRTYEYKNSLAYNPDVAIIQLGTNDTKTWNSNRAESFVADYLSLIKSYSAGENEPVVYISLPPHVFFTAYGINQLNLEKIIPLIFEVANQADVDVTIIDNYTETEKIRALTPDGVHPNAKGATVLANNVYHGLKGDTEIKDGTVTINDYFKTYGGVNTLNKGSLEVQNIGNKDWLSYKKIKLNDKDLQLLAAVSYDQTKVVVHSGDENGKIIGEKVLSRTANLNNYSYQTISLNETPDVHDVTLVFERANTNANIELIRLAKVDFQYDASQPVEITNLAEFETAIASNLTNLKLMADIPFTRNVLLKEDTMIDLDHHELKLNGFYLGKNEATGKRINLSLLNGSLSGTYGYGSLFTNDSTNANYGMNITYEGITFNGRITQRQLSPNSIIIEKGDNQLVHSLGGYNTLIYQGKDLNDSSGRVQLYAAVPYDQTYVTIRKGSKEGEVVAQKLLTRTNNWETYAYHTLDIANVTRKEDLYVSFERKNTAGYTELVRLAKANFTYDTSQPMQINSLAEFETAIASNLTNLKLMADIPFTRNVLLKEDTMIDLDHHELKLNGFYLGKNEATGKRINLSLLNGSLSGTYGYGSLFTNDSTNANYGMNITYEGITFNGRITQRQLSPNSIIIEKGDNQLVHSLGGYNTLIYQGKDLNDSSGRVQLYAAVPYDQTYVTIRKGSKEGEVVAQKLLTRTNNWETYAYHTLDVANVTRKEDLYVSFERKNTAGYIELVRLAKTDVN